MGKSIPWVPESLRLYVFCKGIKFTHLPVDGGLYDQHPDLIEQWEVIMEAEAARKKRDSEKQEAEMRRNTRRRRR